MNLDRPTRVLFLVVEDWFFRTHRLQLARACRDKGAEVHVMLHINGPIPDLEGEGFHVIPWQFKRGSLNPVRELRSFAQVLQVYRRVRPDLVHHVSLKPVIYGGLAARILGIPTVNAVTGLGHVFTASSAKMRVLSGLIRLLLCSVMHREGAKVIFQNREDMALLINDGVVDAADSALIRGSGVDIDQFRPTPEPQGVPTVILATRMLWNKGVGIFVEAVRILQRRGINARFVLVGAPDPESPASVSREQLEAWHQSGILEWWGHRTDMPSVLASSNIVCFPSHYGEGVPKILLEAAAAGRVLITTDSPGCHEAVRHEENGLLVPRRDAVALADAIGRLIADPGLRARLGACGRAIVVREFTVESVIADTLMVYRSLLKSAWPAAELEGAACATIVTRP